MIQELLHMSMSLLHMYVYGVCTFCFLGKYNKAKKPKSKKKISKKEEKRNARHARSGMYLACGQHVQNGKRVW